MVIGRIRPAVLLILLLVAPTLQAQSRITTPKQQFGFNIGDDYMLANYSQLVDYWKKLDGQSDRMSMVDIGKTAEGRTIYMAIITSPANHRKLDRLKQIARRLALAEDISEEDAAAMSREGKAAVWIDGGLHADETLGAQQLIEMVYQMVSRTDAETMRLLDDVVLLAVCVNPDGLDLVANWYMQQADPVRRSTAGLPRLFQKYTGHDNNRDFYMSSQPETEAINRVLFREWFPQIVYNHHQAGPEGTVMFAPPFRDPFNYNYDPLVMTALDEAGAAMHSRFALEGKPGVTTRSGANYSTWWNGGLRTSPYFHNMIGLLTETIGSPTPIDIPFVPGKALPNGDLPLPIAPQRWRFRQSIDYSITANRAVMDYASRNKDRLLFNAYRMGRNAIDRGNRDNWTDTPARISAVEAAAGRDPTRAVNSSYFQMLRNPALRDPRGYVVPSDQADFLTATKFINVLVKNGVTVHRAARSFAAAGKTYPAGSFVVKTAQAFRPQVLDMFEPQNHPEDFAFPGAPPTPPYDIAGWTLAYQMGVKFDPILDGFDGPFKKLAGEVKPPAGRITGPDDGAGFLLSHAINDSFIAVNRLLSSGEQVFWLRNSFRSNGSIYAPGTHFIPAQPGTREKLQRLAVDLGLSFEAVAARPPGDALLLKTLKIGLWDRTGGSIPSGWTRFILEQFEFPFTVESDVNRLAGNYDVLIFVNDGRADVLSAIPELRKFMEDGGTVLAIGGSTALAYRAGLPIVDALGGLAPDKFYIPGSVLEATVDITHPLAFGMGDKANVFVDQSPAFRLDGDAVAKGVHAVAWYGSATPLRSGWAWGQQYLEGAAAVVDVSVGKGKLFLYGPEVLFRSQSHGTFKLVFNGIYFGHALILTQVP